MHASVDILGGYVSDPTSTSSIRIGTLFFDREKLNDWMMQTDKEARALYEKMWVEGTGMWCYPREGVWCYPREGVWCYPREGV